MKNRWFFNVFGVGVARCPIEDTINCIFKEQCCSVVGQYDRCARLIPYAIPMQGHGGGYHITLYDMIYYVILYSILYYAMLFSMFYYII